MRTLLFPIRKAAFTVRSTISQNPNRSYLFAPFVSWGKLKGRLRGKEETESDVSSLTELVIDGFQGSANSFATVAFKYFQTKPIKLAHHLHAPVLIIKAADKGIPVILTIREPLGTVMSLTSRWSYVSVEQALRSYIGFYKCLLPYAEKFIVSDFSSTINGLDNIILALNNKFSTDFIVIDVDVANQVCRAEVSDSPSISAHRKKVKAAKEAELKGSQLALRLLEEANEVYHHYEILHERGLENVK